MFVAGAMTFGVFIAVAAFVVLLGLLVG